MNTRLYDLTSSYLQLMERVEDGNVDPVAIADTLDSITDAIEVKTESIGKLLTMMDADVDAISAEIKRLTDRKKAIENRKEAIKQYVLFEMERANIDKIKTPTMTVSIAKNPPKVEILDEFILPDDFTTVTIQTVPDKKKLLEALKNGQEVPGAKLVQGKSLRIK